MNPQEYQQKRGLQVEFDLTSSQKNFYNDGLTADETMWNHIGIIRFNKRYTRQELSDSLDKLLQLQEGLRLQMKQTPQGPVATIRDFAKREYPFYSFADDAEMENALKAIMNRPRTVYEELFDCAIFQLPDASGYFANIHHILLDGFSTYIIAENLRDGLLHIDMPSDSVLSYAEYVEGENNHRFTKRYARDVAFWKEIFSARPKTALLPSENRSFDFASSEVSRSLSAELLDSVRKYCDAAGVAPDSFFLAVYACYFHRMYHTDQYAVGVPVLNRAYGKQMHTVGLFMHLLPLITDINGEASFAELVAATEENRTNLCRHQKFTQHDLRCMLKEESLAVGSFFDVVADFIEFPKNDDFDLQFFFPQTLSVPLEIHVQGLTDASYQLLLRYRTACFAAHEMHLMADCFLQIAEFAAKNPACAVCDIPVFSAQMQEQTLARLKKLNDTAAVYPQDQCVHELFEQHAAKMPDKTAVVAADAKLTYRQLNQRANRIAHTLIEQGVGKGDLVAVLLPRKSDLLSALFGILKTGAAYLPVDPDYPADRVKHILADSKAKTVIDESTLASLLCTQQTENPGIKANVQDPCYCIYTSGSTGKPKGACISHGALLNRIFWMQKQYPLDSESVILQKTPYTFDVSVWEVFWWGMFGASLALSKPDEHFLPAKILEETEKNKVTHLHFVPSVFDLFLTYLEKNPSQCRRFASVKQVFLSGEALSAALVGRFYALFDYNKVKLANLYGPTECAIDVTFYDCTPQETDPIPIGKPISNTQIYAVDPLMNPMPVGVVGEICIAGDNVGQGYLNNTALTNEKFIPNPFGDGKLYKTGDLGYWREDGNIVFCGRKDNQIKLHGQRIEIGEIESVIAAVQTVQSVAVVLRTLAERQALVAFYCSPADCEQQLRNHCELQLPHYMVPSVFVRFDSMPLNANGKTDRNALLQLPVQMAESPVSDREEVSDDERRICTFFADELGVEIGRNDDFFACGGTSLSMISLLSQDFFKQLSAADFIANPTPAKLALLMKNKQEPDFSVLQRLHTAENAEKALLLFPYAGGDAASFAALVQTFAKNTADYDLYFVPFLHRQEEFEAAAADILLLTDKKQVYFYSHCAGSAVAARVLQILEKEDRQFVSHFVVGGSIPPAKPKKRNVWRTLPFFAWKTALKKAGAPFTSLAKEQTNAVYVRFLEDTDLFFETFGTWQKKLCCPVSLLMSKKDPFTGDYKTAKQIWERYVASVCDVYYINTPSHYFQSHDSDETAAVLLSVFE